MKAPAQTIRTMEDLSVHLLRDIYYAKGQCETALVRFSGKAADALLRQVLNTYTGQVIDQLRRLETVFAKLGHQPQAVAGPVIKSLVEEVDSMIDGSGGDSELLDRMLINAVQAVSHYGMVRYGSLIIWARQQSEAEVAELLQQSLDEDRATDRKLSTLATVPPSHVYIRQVATAD